MMRRPISGNCLERRSRAPTSCWNFFSASWASKSKEAQDALKKFQQEVGALERRSKQLPEIGRRIMHAEVQHLPPVATRVAKVSRPLGTQESRVYRLLGDTKNLDVPKDQDPRGLVVAWMRRPDNPFFAK